jgi:small subunit ribosomal protein S5
MSEKVNVVSKDNWTPKTELGRLVKSGEITTLEQIIDTGKPMLEAEIVDVLLSNLRAETLLIKSTQRATDSGRKMQFRIVCVVGDGSGHVGIGVGKCDEIKPGIDYAMRDAKKNMISIKLGCGSWECKCHSDHSIAKSSMGKQGATVVSLKPAPKGLGIAANATIKKVLSIAGVKDVWSSTTGSTKNVYNTSMATIAALRNITEVKPHPVRGAAS